MSKIIHIEGTLQRYQMKKVEKVEKVKQFIKPILPLKETYSSSLLEEEQLTNLSKIINKEKTEIGKLIEKQIKKKISSYKQQDNLKKIYNNETFISFDEIINKMESEKLQCNYCHSIMCILYEYCREPKQWTLDRINNEKGHNNDNVLLSCMECNLKRRRINKESFEFTKNLQIIYK
jgi:5-methylcytosine-specific restriction endonuclease McrA